jgi:tetratricopeptide (TPR) repeat protein
MIIGLIIFCCWIVSFFFNGIESGLLSIDPVRLRQNVKRRVRAALRLNRLLKRPERLLVTVLLITNAADIVGLLLLTRQFVQAYGSTGFAYALLIAHVALGALQSETSPILAAVLGAGLAVPQERRRLVDDWRRGGDLKRAVEHKHHALHLYERLGDRQSILKTYGNLSLIYGDAKDFARAIDYSQRVLDMAQRFTVEPETLAATHLHLGATPRAAGSGAGFRYKHAVDPKP